MTLWLSFIVHTDCSPLSVRNCAVFRCKHMRLRWLESHWTFPGFFFSFSGSEFLMLCLSCLSRKGRHFAMLDRSGSRSTECGDRNRKLHRNRLSRNGKLNSELLTEWPTGYGVRLSSPPILASVTWFSGLRQPPALPRSDPSRTEAFLVGDF